MTTSDNVGLACSITDRTAFETRRLSIIELFKGATRSQFTANGVTLTFPSDGTWFTDLAAFIDSERQCCAFFQFDLRVTPHNGPISLTVSGAKGVKAFIQQQFSNLRDK